MYAFINQLTAKVHKMSESYNIKNITYTVHVYTYIHKRLKLRIRVIKNKDNSE